MLKIKTFIVDSFTDQPFKGNPAGVCLLDHPLSEAKMLAIAQELGLSETAFVYQRDEQESYSIRYFSPVMEIPLCGHATLAASKVIFRNYNVSTIHFVNTQNLDLITKLEGERITMQFPVYDTFPQSVPTEVLKALGIDQVVNSEYNKETNILLLEIKSCQVLSALTPNFEQLKKAHDSINGVLVTSLSNRPNYDFESRYFWPWSGTNEDPVTGGTHTFLAKYWSKRLQKKRMNSFQCSKRTGFMEVELIDKTNMTIKGYAQIVLEGELSV